MTVTVGQPTSMFRVKEGLGVWEHRGRVAAVGVGHSPTARRWDLRPENTVGAWTILAIRRAIEDAGVDPSEVDGLAICDSTTTGAYWTAGRKIPQDFLDMFNQTNDPLDGMSKNSIDWILKNMPELSNVKFVMTVPACMSMVLAATVQAVGDGLTNVCIAAKGWHNFDGRHYQGGANAEPTVSGPGKWSNSLAGPASYTTAMQFQRYLHKYGGTHDMMAPFMVNSRKNGLLMPEGYWAQHRPEPLTEEDYINVRWVAKPANLLDNDIPIQAAAAYLITTADRAKDMKQKPVYILGHAGAGTVGPGTFYSGVKSRGTIETLEEAEANAASTGRKILEGAGISTSDITFENMYDGFSLFHVFHIEGLGFAGLKPGEALDFFKTDISNSGPNPVSPSGGNIGSGRTRWWGHTDTIQQIQGRAGARQISIPAQIGVTGGFMPFMSNFLVMSATPN
jgi:acetyl-CoA acetyltransferase